MDPGLPGVYSQNTALSDTQPVDSGVVNLSESRAQGYDPPPRGSQFGSDWRNLNQDGYYQPMQIHSFSNLTLQHAFDQERYAAQLAEYYQSVAEQNAKAAEERSVYME